VVLKDLDASKSPKKNATLCAIYILNASFAKTGSGQT